jgi:hypothetical protein
MLESLLMAAEHGRECPAKSPVVETILAWFDDHLVSDQRESNFATLLHVHRLGEVPGNKDPQASADPLHPPAQRHGKEV